MADILTFSGTPSAVYSPPAGWTNRGDNFRIGLDGASISGGSLGTYSQLVSDTTASGLYESIVTFDRIAAGSGDSIASLFINSSRNGFALEFGSAGGGTIYCNKQIGGGNTGLIIPSTSGLGEPLGINTIRVTWNLATGIFEVFYNGVSVAVSTYNDFTAGMNAGGAIYRDGAPINITITQLQSGIVASASIDSVTTDGNPGFVVGRPFTYTKTGLGTITGFTVTTAATPAATTSAINLSAGAGELKSWIDGDPYPFIGTVEAEADDGTLTGTGNFPLALPAGEVDVTFSTVETTDATYIGTKLAGIGHPLADGDKGYYPTGNGLVISPNSHVSCLGAMVFVLWVQKLTTGLMERYNVTINDAGEITDVRGISSRGISSRGISSRGISSRGIA